MATLQGSDILDLVKACLPDYDAPKWTDISLDHQEHVAMSQLMRKERVSIDGGTTIQRTLMVDTPNIAQHVGLFETINVDFTDVMQTISIGWFHTNTNFPIEDREIEMNAEPKRIYNLVKSRETQALNDLAKKMESTFWGPAVDDGKTPFSLQYWLTYNATTGFNGGNNAAFSGGPGGLDSSTYTRWRNFTAQYTDVTKDDLVDKMSEASVKCRFIMPNPAPSHEKGPENRFGIYMNYNTWKGLKRIGEAQNENLGRDIDSLAGRVTFRGVPLTYVPFLDDYTTSEPVWMVDWNVFWFVILNGEYLHRESFRSPTQPRTTITTIDLSWNTLCVNRRRCALIAKADPQNGV